MSVAAVPAVIGEGIPLSERVAAPAATTEIPVCDPVIAPAVAVMLSLPAVFRVKDVLQAPPEKEHVVEDACASDEPIVAVAA